MAELIEFLTSECDEVEVVGDVQMSRDPDDDVLIETAGVRQCPGSRDEDFTRAGEVVSLLDSIGARVLTVARFLALLETQESGASV